MTPVPTGLTEAGYNRRMPPFRLLPFAAASGAENMARDEAMLHAAERGVASLRFYTWTAPTLSLGYFQPSADRHTDTALSQMAWVRRATGGAAIVHDPAHEITYSLALPPGERVAAARRISGFAGCIMSSATC